MNSQNIKEILQQNNRFTGAEQQVTGYILAHAEEVSTMNISDLANAAYTSNGTIIRICRKLGLSGFKELKHELTKELEAERYRQGQVDFNTPFGTHQNVPEIIQSMADLYRESVDVTAHALNYRTIHAAAQRLYKSRHIVLFANGDTYITCAAFVNKLVKIGIYCILANTYGDQHYVAGTLTKEDCALLVSYGGISIAADDSLNILVQKKVPIIAITSNPASPIALDSSISIIIPHKEGETGEKIGTFYSQVAISMILNILYSLLYALQEGK